LLTAAGWNRLADQAVGALDEYHRRFPARSGMPRMELASRLKLGNLVAPALAKLAGQGILVESGGQVRRPSHEVKVTPEQQAKIDSFLNALQKNPYSPPSDIMPEPDLLNLLIGQGKVVRAAENIVFAASAYEEIVRRVTARIKVQGKISLGETRDMFQTSRKYAQAILDQMDGSKITRRVGDDRVLY
jgi:selenocysteine-specific elongation factor